MTFNHTENSDKCFRSFVGNDCFDQYSAAYYQSMIDNSFAGDVMKYVLSLLENKALGELISTDDVLYEGPFWTFTQHDFQLDRYTQSIFHLVALELLPVKHIGRLDAGHDVYRIIDNDKG